MIFASFKFIVLSHEVSAINNQKAAQFTKSKTFENNSHFGT